MSLNTLASQAVKNGKPRWQEEEKTCLVGVIFCDCISHSGINYPSKKIYRERVQRNYTKIINNYFPKYPHERSEYSLFKKFDELKKERCDFREHFRNFMEIVGLQLLESNYFHHDPTPAEGLPEVMGTRENLWSSEEDTYLLGTIFERFSLRGSLHRKRKSEQNDDPWNNIYERFIIKFPRRELSTLERRRIELKKHEMSKYFSKRYVNYVRNGDSDIF